MLLLLPPVLLASEVLMVVGRQYLALLSVLLLLGLLQSQLRLTWMRSLSVAAAQGAGTGPAYHPTSSHCWTLHMEMGSFNTPIISSTLIVVKSGEQTYVRSDICGKFTADSFRTMADSCTCILNSVGSIQQVPLIYNCVSKDIVTR